MTKVLKQITVLSVKRPATYPVLVGVSLLLFCAGVGHATVPLEAVLLAEQTCPALASIKRDTNPGNLGLTPGERYRVIGKNREDASHYLIQLDRTPPAQRWVAANCGRLSPESPTPVTLPDRTGKPSRESESPTDRPRPPQQLVLAASWQNAFCTFSTRSPECLKLDPGDAAAQRFSLHGLWPQPMGNSYCGVSDRDRRDSKAGEWHDLPRVELRADIRARLDGLMPGTRSDLQRHQWTKHGTCYGTDANTYFVDALELMEQLNASPVRTLFANNLGKHLSATEVRDAFNRAFGRSAGRRARLECKDGLITELRISLRGAPGTAADLREWLSTAPAKSGGCRGGRIQR